MSYEAIEDAEEKCRMLKDRNRDVRLAYSKAGDAIGEWIDDEKGFVEIAMKTTTGAWVYLKDEQGVIHHVLYHGKPIYGPEDWIEVD